MRSLRLLIQRYPQLAAIVVVVALALRVLLPAGYMPMQDHGRIVVTICNGSPDGPGTMVMAISGLKHKQQPADSAHGKCAYANLPQVMTGGVDPVLLPVALAFVLALALTLALTLPPRPTARLRPPLRGPPLFA